MSPQLPDAPRTADPAPWPARARGLHAAGSKQPSASRMLAVAAGILGVCILAAWTIPPLLEWGRFRTAIAAFVTGQLGRPVVIGGEVTLRLLPEAVLTATEVSLPDSGDGVSAQLGAVRLQVSMLPLLAGRIVPRDLVLGTPVLHLPWPLPGALTHPTRPSATHAFAAHVENGTVLAGWMRVTGINAGIHSSPDPAGFGAEGFAAFGGRSWRFTSALGAPDADGVSAVDLAVSGQGSAGKTGGTLEGTLAKGVIQGRLHAGGPDLSLLMPASSQIWRVDAPFVASGAQVEAEAISLSVGGSAADASLVARLTSPARLDGRLHAASIDLNGWARVLRLSGVLAAWHVPSRVTWAADTARVFDGTVSGLHGTLIYDGGAFRLEGVEAVLPGRAHIGTNGVLTWGKTGPRLTGPVRLDAPDLPSTLAWLHGQAPALIDAVPQNALQHATLTGTGSLNLADISLRALAGEIDGVGLKGSLDLGFGSRPRLQADLSFARPTLDGWAPAAWPGGAGLAALGRMASRLDADLHLGAQAATWHGTALHDVALDLRTGPAGVAVTRFATNLAGARLSAAGSLAPDGAIADGKLSITTGELEPLLGLIPPGWRVMPGLWHGPGSLQAAAAGPLDALATQWRVEVGDLLLEADLRGNLPAAMAIGTMTVRHPGAPRLLATLGLGGAERWLETGSLALRAQVALRPGQVDIPDFSLSAADLQVSGQAGFDFSQAVPAVHGSLDASLLALPNPLSAENAFKLAWLNGWTAQLHLTASRVTLDRVQAASAAIADVSLAGGKARVNVRSAQAYGGTISAQLAFDTTAGDPKAGPPMSTLEGEWSGIPSLDPTGHGLIRAVTGKTALGWTLSASGSTEAAVRHSLAGHVQATLLGAELAGFSLADAKRALDLRGSSGRLALLAAMTHASSPGLSGTLAGDVAAGQLHLKPARLVSADGSLDLLGTVNFDTGANLDLSVTLLPDGVLPNRPDLAGAASHGISIRVTGPWGGPRVAALPVAAIKRRPHASHR